jgi:hypothetical protein
VVTAIACKDAEMVADAIYKEWFLKFGIPAQIHMDGSKEFVNKLSAELFQLLNVSHTKLLRLIRNAMPKWKFLIRPSRSYFNPSWMTPLLTGKLF